VSQFQGQYVLVMWCNSDGLALEVLSSARAEGTTLDQFHKRPEKCLVKIRRRWNAVTLLAIEECVVLKKEDESVFFLPFSKLVAEVVYLLRLIQRLVIFSTTC